MEKKDISRKYNVSPLVANVLATRGINSKEKLDNLFYGSFDDLNDPALIPNIDNVASDIKKHLYFGDNIMIFGDYDADGVTSIVTMYKALKRMGKYTDVEWMVGNRYKDGYGLSKRVIDICDKKNIKLIISLDCGISNLKEIQYAMSKGINVVVIDHHERDGDLPDANFIDLKVERGEYGFDQLCACGATWKLSQYLLDDEFYEALDIVALSTIADMVPLIGENRIIVKEGLKKIKKGEINPGINELMFRKEINNKEIKSHHFGFGICPMINAPGRLDSAKPSVDILLSNEYDDISRLGYELFNTNEERKEITKKHVKKAKGKINKDENVIFYKDDIREGVVGIVAGDLKEEFNKPTIVLAKSKESFKGSCRSLRPFDMYKNLKMCSDYLNTFGGHKMAAGLSLDNNNYDDFYTKMQELSKGIEYEDIKYDLEVHPKEMTKAKVKEINKLEPFGIGFSKPKFYQKNLRLKRVRKTRSGEHLLFEVSEVSGIAFNCGDKYDLCKNNNVNIIYQPDINEYNGKKSLQIKVKKIERS